MMIIGVMLVGGLLMRFRRECAGKHQRILEHGWTERHRVTETSIIWRNDNDSGGCYRNPND